MVLTSMIGQRLIGPVELPRTSNGERSLKSVQNNLSQHDIQNSLLQAMFEETDLFQENAHLMGFKNVTF